MSRDADEAARRAQADLRRLGEQSEKLLADATEAPAAAEDSVELWGRRLGRGLGYLFTLYLVWHLYGYFTTPR